MRKNNRLVNPGPLLDEKGNLVEAGYATSLVKQYDRAKIKAGLLRIKEWDYYYVGNSHYGVALTVADNGYMSMFSISMLDFDSPKDISSSKIGFFPKGKLKLPSTSEKGDIDVSGKGFRFRFLHENGMRRLIVDMEKLFKGSAFHCDILLEETQEDSLVVATPFRQEAHFYYNQKINCLRAHGYAKCGDIHYDFNEDSYGVLDWGRGVWTYRNTWYWSSASAKNGDHLIGWNLGYGFGDTSAASENMVYVDGKSFKLGNVRMNIPLTKIGRDNFMGNWRFKDDDGYLSLVFHPIYDRHSDTNLLFLRSNQHQVFGTFTGFITFEGQQIAINEMPGFAEKVFNKW